MAAETKSTPSRPISDSPASPGPLERIPPQDIEAEMALLGAMMLDREVIGDVTPIIHPDDVDRFYRPDHRKIFETLCQLYERGEPVDLVVVRDELRRRGILDQVGGVDYIAQLAESIPNHLHAEYYARIVRDKAMLRDLIGVAARINDSAYEPRDDARAILDEAEEMLFRVTDQRISEQATQIREQLEAVFSQIEAREGHYISGVATGFVELDDLLSGLQPGEMIVIAARPSMGKTAFGLTIAEHIAANDGIPVAFFSMEMSKQSVAQRLLCARARVNSHRVRRNMVSEEDIQELQQACAELSDMPLYVDDTPGMSALELRAKTRRLHQRHGIKAVFIDYLQLMHGPAKIESRQQEVAQISRGLKALARDLNIPVVVMAQLNRNPEGRTDKKPILSDLRESGAIEQDADVVILLHREDYYFKIKGEEPPEEVRGQADIIVAKQRNGPTRTVKLQFTEELTRFENLSVGGEPAYIPNNQYTAQPVIDDSAPF